MGMGMEGTRRRGERDVSHSSTLFSSSWPRGLAMRATTYLRRWRVRVCVHRDGASPSAHFRVHWFYWLMHSALVPASWPTPHPYRHHPSRLPHGADARLGVSSGSFRPWMGMQIVALAVDTHNERWWVQGSILSTSNTMPVYLLHNPNTAPSAAASSFVLPFALLCADR
ncbi:hypothetical protein B0H13DRAFT_2036501 [Mycena leptocephala]|nr:hypothetical protein B0H13DRAFT_2036501 [Mycena leptocephala]